MLSLRSGAPRGRWSVVGACALGWSACGGAPPPPDPAPALDRARAWMAAWPGQPSFDSAIAAHETWELRRDDGWKALRDQRIAGIRDTDHEHRRFFEPTARLPVAHVHRWSPPTDGTRVNPNRVITEALYCPETGWRPDTERYACGAMRDDGGYHTTHALWALVVARDNGCTQAACAPELVAELVTAQPAELAPARSLDVDLYAERLLTTCLVACPDGSDAWARALLDAQLADGSWGVADDAEPPYHRYHATMMTAWALSAWWKQRAAHPG